MEQGLTGGNSSHCSITQQSSFLQTFLSAHLLPDVWNHPHSPWQLTGSRKLLPGFTFLNTFLVSKWMHQCKSVNSALPFQTYIFIFSLYAAIWMPSVAIHVAETAPIPGISLSDQETSRVLLRARDLSRHVEMHLEPAPNNSRSQCTEDNSCLLRHR